KLAAEDASIGIDQGSVVTCQEQLGERAAQLLDHYRQPVLIEEFIDGREFNVAIIENPDLQVLPIAEIVFAETAAKRWRIVSYEAKWAPGSTEDRATVPRCPTDLSPRLADELTHLAVRAYQLLDCRDYARIDFRVTHAGEPYILEINPNPDLHP